MKPYYIMIHFEGPYVDGFIVPQAIDEYHALRILKNLIRVKIEIMKRNGLSSQNDPYNHFSRQLAYMRSLKRPWRYAGNNRTKGEKKSTGFSNNNHYPVIRIVEHLLPAQCGYWLEDIITGSDICDMHNEGEVKFRDRT
jgi:hypothetical protein